MLIVIGNVDITSRGSYAWTIDVPDEMLVATPKFVLRFKLPGEDYDETTPRLNTPGFLLLRPLGGDNQTVTAPLSSQKEGSLNSGTKVAIGLGVVFGVAVVVGTTAFVMLRKRIEKVVKQLPLELGSVQRPK
jgi:hypothetical protein